MKVHLVHNESEIFSIYDVSYLYEWDE